MYLNKICVGLILSSLAAAPMIASAASDTSTTTEGTQVVKGDWSFHTALLKKGMIAQYGQFCGGSYLGGGYVLTSANCVVERKPESFDVVIGIADLSSKETEKSRLAVESVTVHKDFTDNHNDIAIIKLKQDDQLKQLKPVVLANAAETSALTAGTELTALGWGATTLEEQFELPPFTPSEDAGNVPGASSSDKSASSSASSTATIGTKAKTTDKKDDKTDKPAATPDPSDPSEPADHDVDNPIIATPVADTLHVQSQVNVPFVDLGTCQGGGLFYDALSDDNLCAGQKGDGTDACYGDAGSPLMAKIDGVYKQVGIVSWAMECGKGNTVYSNVGYFDQTGWLKENTSGIDLY